MFIFLYRRDLITSPSIRFKVFLYLKRLTKSPSIFPHSGRLTYKAQIEIFEFDLSNKILN